MKRATILRLLFIALLSMSIVMSLVPVAASSTGLPARCGSSCAR